MSKVSQVRLNFRQECEDAINKQINVEFNASYVYIAMAYHFHRDDMALMGFHKYFKDASDEERQHAKKLMEYLNKRGGRIVLEDIKAPTKQIWETAQDALNDALELEKEVNDGLLNLHKIAAEAKDAHFCDFLETHYLSEQVDAIKEISDHITNLKRVGDGLGVFLFDQKLME